MEKFARYSDKNELSKRDPTRTWDALVDAEIQEDLAAIRKDVERKVRELAQAAQDERGHLLREKVLDIVLREVLPVSMPRPRLAEDRDRGVAYLYQSSIEESMARERVADAIWHEMSDVDFGVRFGEMTPRAYLADWLRRNPDLVQTVNDAQSRPEVEKQALEREIPAWQTAIEIAVGFIPIVGTIVGAVEVATGRDLFGNKLSDAERAVMGACLLLPAAARVFKIGKGLVGARSLVREYALVGAEADAAYRAMVPLKPGSLGAWFLEKSRKKLAVGGKLDDKELAYAKQLLREMGDDG